MKKNILVVDDNQMMIKFMTNLLEREGHRVVAAEDGFEALNLLTDFVPDIIFVDLIMPKIGGDKLCQIVRKMTHLQHCYIVLVSAAVAEMDFDYTETGADTCIAKGPFNTMAEHVRQVLGEVDEPRSTSARRPIMGIEDVSHRRMTQELLSKSRHLETILESIDEGILEIYSDRIVYANSAAVALFGETPENLLGSEVRELFTPSAARQVADILPAGRADTIEIGLNDPLDLHGRLITVKQLPVRDEPDTSILLITDVTKQKALELQLRHAQKMEAIGTISSGVAHNFRNTLAGILMNNQVIETHHNRDEKLLELTGRISTAVRHGADLVDGLLQFSRKQVKNNFERLDLRDVVDELHALIRESFDRKIEILISRPEPMEIMGDKEGLLQAFFNLCTNSRDAMPAGGKLSISTQRGERKAVVTFSDSGVGMDAEALSNCYDPFFTTKEVGKGTGLGLSTTYGIVQSHEGSIRVHSEKGLGSVFQVEIPLADARQKAIPEDRPNAPYGNGQRILVVDDELIMLKAVPDLLGAIGYQTAIASNPKDALELYDSWGPDVVLLDRNMPEMDGKLCAEKILSRDPKARIVIISGYDPEGEDGLDPDFRKQIHGYLTKPIHVADLQVLLANLLHIQEKE